MEGGSPQAICHADGKSISRADRQDAVSSMLSSLDR
jgi:hypothetical protein